MTKKGLIPARLALARKVDMSDNGYQQKRLREQIERDEIAGGIDMRTAFQFLGNQDEDMDRASLIEWARREETPKLIPDDLPEEKVSFTRKILALIP